MADKKISALTAATTPLAGTEVLPIVQSSTTVKASIANIQAAPVAVGTAKGVQYLSASKVPTTSTDLLFDGTTVAVGGTQSAWSGVGNAVQLTGTALWGSGAVGHFSLNTYFDGSNYKYIDTGAVTDYYQFGGSHVFRYAPSGTAGDNVTAFATAFSTTAAGNIAFPAGQGIDFSADPSAAGMTSELLDDYEEGTWTPGITSSSGTITTVGAVSGYYTKVGRKVTVWASVTITNNGTGAGAILFSGLPFASQNTIRNAGVGWNQSSAKIISAYVNAAQSAGACWYYDATYPVNTGESFVFCVSYNV